MSYLFEESAAGKILPALDLSTEPHLKERICDLKELIFGHQITLKLKNAKTTKHEQHKEVDKQ